MTDHDVWCDRSCDCGANPDREAELLSKIALLERALTAATELVGLAVAVRNRSVAEHDGNFSDCDGCVALKEFDEALERATKLANEIRERG